MAGVIILDEDFPVEITQIHRIYQKCAVIQQFKKLEDDCVVCTTLIITISMGSPLTAILSWLNTK